MKFCHRCKLAIEKNERQIKVEDIENSKVLSKLHFHKKCWSLLITNKEKERELFGMAKNFITNANKKIGMEEEKVVNF